MSTEETIFQKADAMRDSLTALLHQLAKDGMAIQEFAEAYKALEAYTRAVFDYRVDKLISKKQSDPIVVSNGITYPNENQTEQEI